MQTITEYAAYALDYVQRAAFGLPPDYAALVADDVYIGSIATIRGSAYSGVGLIVNMSGESYDVPVPVYTVSINDVEVQPGQWPQYIKAFDDAATAIQSARGRGERVLVHCHAGINRSATAIGYYLLRQGMPLNDVFNALCTANDTRRVPVLTNKSFRTFLHAAYDTICKYRSQRLRIARI